MKKKKFYAQHIWMSTKTFNENEISNLQYLNNVIINKTKVLLTQSYRWPEQMLAILFKAFHSFKLFGFRIFGFCAHRMKFIPLTRRAHKIWCLHLY